MDGRVGYYSVSDLNPITWLCRSILSGNMGMGHVDILFDLLVAPHHIFIKVV